jgi:hypothetical protein
MHSECCTKHAAEVMAKFFCKKEKRGQAAMHGVGWLHGTALMGQLELVKWVKK